MKIFITTLSLIFTISLSAQTMQQIDGYMQFFNNQQIEVSNLAMAYLQYSVHSDDMGLIEKKRQELVQQLNTSISVIEQVEPLEKDGNLKATSLEVFRSHLNSFNLDFVELMDLKVQSQTSYEAMEKYFAARKEAEQKVEEASERYYEAQLEFAKLHNMEIREAEGNEQVKELNQLNNYHQAIFMKYSKIVMHNNDFINALNSQDADAIEKARTQLEKDSEENLKILKAMPAFKEDMAYRDAAIEVVRQINELAKTTYKELEEVSKKDAMERTQEDVNTYNENMQKLQTVLPQLNVAVMEKGNELLKKYVPKPRMTRDL